MYGLWFTYFKVVKNTRGEKKVCHLSDSKTQIQNLFAIFFHLTITLYGNAGCNIYVDISE